MSSPCLPTLLYKFSKSLNSDMFMHLQMQKYMPRRKAGEEMNFTYVECLLYTFNNLAHKVFKV